MLNKDDVRNYVSGNYKNLSEIAGEVGFSESTVSRLQCGKQAIPEWMSDRVLNDQNQTLNKVGMRRG